MEQLYRKAYLDHQNARKSVKKAAPKALPFRYVILVLALLSAQIYFALTLTYAEKIAARVYLSASGENYRLELDDDPGGLAKSAQLFYQGKLILSLDDMAHMTDTKRPPCGKQHCYHLPDNQELTAIMSNLGIAGNKKAGVYIELTKSYF